jgi:hypothetical protein
VVPTLVPKPGSPTVTQQNLPGYEIEATRALGLPWVTSGHEICSLKIRVSVVDLLAVVTDAVFLVVEAVDEVIEACLLLQQVVRGGLGRFGLQSQVHAAVTVAKRWSTSAPPAAHGDRLHDRHQIPSAAALTTYFSV